MALETTNFAVDAASVVIRDYAGTPNTTDPLPVDVGSLVFPLIDEVSKETIMIMSGSGQTRHGETVNGVAGWQMVEFTVIMSDLVTSDVDNYTALLLGLQNDTLPAAFSAWDFASQLPGGGGPQCDLLITLTAMSGTEYLITVPVSIRSVKESKVGLHRALAVSAETLGAPVRTIVP